MNYIYIEPQWIIQESEKQLLLDNVCSDVLEDMLTRYQFHIDINGKSKKAYIHKYKEQRLLLNYI